MKLPYSEGTLFAVPLRNGGFGVGVVSRLAKNGKILAAYFFGKKWIEVPSLSDINLLAPNDSIKGYIIGDLGLINGDWPIIGKLSLWERDSWPIPQFVRNEPFTGRIFLVTYDENNPAKIKKEEAISKDRASHLSSLEKDGLLGYGAVEIVLTEILG